MKMKFKEGQQLKVIGNCGTPFLGPHEFENEDVVTVNEVYEEDIEPNYYVTNDEDSGYVHEDDLEEIINE